MRESLRSEVTRCGACHLCMDVCPSYNKAGDERFSPMYRLHIASELLNGKQPDASMKEVVADCTLCGECDGTCSEEIAITEVMRELRAEFGLTKPKPGG